MIARLSKMLCILSLFTIACKGCGKDGDQNPNLDDLTVEQCDNGEDDNSDGLTDCQQPVCQLLEVCAFEPPNPDELAPEIDPTNLVGFADSVRFLYEGDNPVIRGVDPNVLDETRIAVLRARVVDAAGNPVSGILANVAGQPGLGYTFSRADGAIDLVANGDSKATIRMQARGFLAVDRSVDAPARDFTSAEDIVLTPLSEKKTRLKGGGLAAGEPTDDADGARTARVWFPKDTVATVHLPDGQKGDISEFDVRLTEYTVGDTGPAAMPALLPDDSAYTYAVELSLDEAEDVGASEVSFNKTGWLYLDNFLDFEVGQTVPSGFYSRARLGWEAEANGRVLQRVGDGVDIGSGSAASKSDRDDIGLSKAELDAILDSFADGESFWRVPVNHFSPYDLNWPYNLPEGAVQPDEIDFEPRLDRDPCAEAGSVIECQNQAMMKSVQLPGTGLALSYRSDRTKGRYHAFELPLTGDEVSSVLKKLIVVVDIRGRQFTEEFEPTSNLIYSFEWDGKDVYGRDYYGETPIKVRVAHVYEAQFAEPALGQSFGATGGGNVRPARADVSLWRRYGGKFGSFDARAAFNMGGWALDLQHAYDGGRQAFYPAGAPEARRADLSRIISNFETFPKPSGLPIEPADRLPLSMGVYTTQDNALFIMLHPGDGDSTVIVKRHADGRLQHWAGAVYDDFNVPDSCRFNDQCGEGGPPKEATLTGLRWAVGPDDAIYVGSGRCLRRVTEDTVEIVAGETCLPGEEPDGQRGFPNIDDIAIGPNSQIYLSNGSEIIRSYPGEKRFDVLAGCYSCDTELSAGASPLETHLAIEGGIAATPDGSIYFFQYGETLVRLRNGRLEALDFVLDRQIKGITAGPDGAVYWLEHVGLTALQLKRFKDGNVATLAGAAELDATEPEALSRAFDADGIPATEAWLQPFGDPAVGRDGSIYLMSLNELDDGEPDGDDGLETVVKRIGSAFPSTLGGDEALLASPSGRHLYRFAPTGQLQDIRSSWNHLVLQTLGYGDDGLKSVTTRDQLEVAIERDAQGQLKAIVGPYGHRTEIELDANGYISEFTYPDGSVRQAEYTDGGLLTSWRDGVGAESTYEYDVMGLLTRTDDPEGGWKTLTRTRSGVILETATGRRVDFSGDAQAFGNTVITTDAAGRTWQTTYGRFGRKEVQEPDGTIRSTQFTSDPRFGQQAQYVGESSTQTPGGLEQISMRSKQVTLFSDDPTRVRTATKTLDINGAITTYEYDGEAHATTRTSAMGRVTRFAYDAKNRGVSLTAGDFDPLLVEYDDNGRLQRVTHGTSTTAGTYGPSGRLDELTGPDGVARFTRDEMGRLTSVTSTSGITRSTGYDDNGRTTEITTDIASNYTFGYNGYDLPISLTHPSGDSDRYAWNADRRLALITRANGMSHDVNRDEAGRVSGWTTERGATTRTINPQTGQTVRSETPDGAVDLTWDGFLITGLDIAFQGQQHTIRRELDNNFRITQRTVDGVAVIHQHDLDGAPTRVGAADLTYGTSGELIAMSVGGVDITYGWDSRGRLQSLSYQDGGTDLYSAAYTYDTASRRAALDETIEGAISSVVYGYDLDGQLTAVTRDAVNESLAYDVRGNRTGFGARNATYNSSDQIQTAGARTYTVDASGFVTGWSDGTTTSLRYDGHNLIEVATATGSIQYGYDAQGRRIWRAVDGTFDRGWLYDDTDRPVAEVDATGGVLSRFVYAASDVVPTTMQRDGNTYLLVAEPNGSIRLVVDTASGQVVQRIAYDALGGVLADSNPGFQPFGYGAGLYDPATSLVRFGARDYDPYMGRFLSPEPLGFGGGQLNLFAFARNDGINFSDPHGDSPIHFAYGAVILVGSAGVYVGLVYDSVLERWNGEARELPSNRRAAELAELHGVSRKDAENAMRHCTRTCDQVKAGGPLGGEMVTKAANAWHETGSVNEEGGSNYYDHLKDVSNNVTGIKCADDEEDCLEKCAEKFTNGQLATDTPVAPDMSVDQGFSSMDHWGGL